MIINDLIAIIESFAPFGNAESFDNVGLIIGNSEAEITGVLITLDMTEDTIKEANELGFNTILTHHPAIFHPLKRITSEQTVFKAIRNNINVISAHTNLDRSLLGVNIALANKIGLPNPLPLFTYNEEKLDFGYGCLSILERPISAKNLSTVVKDTLGCGAVRYFDYGKVIRNVAVIGGSGGSMLSDAKSAGALYMFLFRYFVPLAIVLIFLNEMGLFKFLYD